MIVAFMFDFMAMSPRSLAHSNQGEITRFFYNCVALQKATHGPVVAPAIYFKEIAFWAKSDGVVNTPEAWKRRWSFDMPTMEDIESVQQVVFPQTLFDDCAREKGSYTDAATFLHAHVWPPLVDWIVTCLEGLRAQAPIECVFTISQSPSLEAAAEKLDIPCRFTELGPLRQPVYANTMYWAENGTMIPASSCEKEYTHFLAENQASAVPILSRKALLSLMLEDTYLPLLALMDQQPPYELGVVAQTPFSSRLASYTLMNTDDMLRLAQQNYRDDEVLVRYRPDAQNFFRFNGMDFDDSKVGAQFLCKCKRIVGIQTNMSFEAMLWGRTSHVLGFSTAKFMALHDLRDKSECVPPDTFLSFYILGHLVPYELGADLSYLQWRLSNPPQTEIYQKHLDYYLGLRGLTLQLDAPQDLMAQILAQRGVDAQGLPLGREDYRPLLLQDAIYSVELETGGQVYPRIYGLRDGSFAFAFDIEAAGGEATLQLSLPSHSRVEEIALLADGVEVPLSAQNALADQKSFLPSMAIWSCPLPPETTHVAVHGSMEKIDLEAFLHHTTWKAVSLEQAAEAKDQYIAALEDAMKSKDQYIAVLEGAATDRDAYVQHLEEKTAGNDSHIAYLAELLSSKNQWIGALEAAVEDKDQYIAQQGAWIAELEGFKGELEAYQRQFRLVMGVLRRLKK